MNDRQIDELIDRALREEQQLPEGLAGRLERHVDALAGRERTVRRWRAMWLSGAAAVAVMIAAVFIGRDRTPVDTYNDPQEATVAVEAALGMLSANYNMGLDQMAAAVAGMERANEFVFKTIRNEEP